MHLAYHVREVSFKWWHIIYTIILLQVTVDLIIFLGRKWKATLEMKASFWRKQLACLPTSYICSLSRFIIRATAGCRQALLMVTKFLHYILNYHLLFCYSCVYLSIFLHKLRKHLLVIGLRNFLSPWLKETFPGKILKKMLVVQPVPTSLLSRSFALFLQDGH